jgi:glycosyltransferase involved in cell wall biosynthesis
VSEQKRVAVKYGIDKSYIIFLSTIEPRKNVDGLLDAYSLLPEDVRQQTALVLIGSAGWLNGKTVSRIKMMKESGYDIVWPSTYVPDSDLPALLSGASIMVHPAFYEGFGISPLQSMACKTPVIVSRNSSLTEVVGDAGLYVDPNSARNIADKILVLLGDKILQKKLSLAGHKRAELFSWSKSADMLSEIILELNHDIR